MPGAVMMGALGARKRRSAAASMLFVSLLAIQSTLAQAQTGPLAPPTREEVERVPVRTEADRRARLEVVAETPAAPCALDDARFGNVRITLNAVEFDGLGPVSPALVQDSYAGLVGTEQPVSVLCRIR